MSESYREQFPLLCDDLSDGEHYSPQFQRKYRQMTYRGRARSNVKGAVAIIKRWPEHWSSFLTYWWLGVVMICLMTFILYNSLLAFSILPTANFKPIKSQIPNLNTIRPTSRQISQFPSVYIHVFTDDKEEVNLNKYLPYIKAMANKYPTFNYRLITVINDTSTESDEFTAEVNNANALNTLWAKDIANNVKTVESNIKIENISLSKYMDNSPLSKHWKILPNELVQFFIKAISIWEKGGITFSPIILTQESPGFAYVNKLENILKHFGHSEIVESFHKKTEPPSNISHPKFKQNVNNIRDVINALENENNLDFSHDEILAEAESKNGGLTTHIAHRRSISRNITSRTTKSINKKKSNTKPSVNNVYRQENTQAIQDLSNNNNSSTLTILPAFLEYLFNHNTKNNRSKEKPNEDYTKEKVNYVSNEKHFKDKANIVNKYNSNLSSKKSLKANKKLNLYKPMIVPANEDNTDKNETNKHFINNEYLSRNGNEDQHLTIDLKGNLLATETACHAFLGTIFTDAIHCGRKETLSNFIIRELSIFCKGVLTSCSGIDLILL